MQVKVIEMDLSDTKAKSLRVFDAARDLPISQDDMQTASLIAIWHGDEVLVLKDRNGPAGQIVGWLEFESLLALRRAEWLGERHG